MNGRWLRRVFLVILTISANVAAAAASASEPRRPEPPSHFLRSVSGTPLRARPDMSPMESSWRERLEQARQRFVPASQPKPIVSSPASECGGWPSIDGAIVNGVIDPVRIGFSPSLPTNGWNVNSVSFNALPNCGPDGNAGSPMFNMSSILTHEASRFYVGLNQSTSPTESANVLETWGSSFWWNGYRYDAYLSGVVGDETPNGSGEDALTDLVASVTPNLSLDCFYRRSQGTWEELPHLGIGDIRPVLPTGFSSQSFNLYYLAEPRQVCGHAPRPIGTYFAASFQRESDGSWVSANAYEIDRTLWPDSGPGYFDANTAYWTSDRYAFSVYAYGSPSEPLDTKLIEEIARALDPAVDFTCFATTAQLTRDDVTGLGFHPPVPPIGFRETMAWLTRYGSSSLCPSAPPPIYSMYWSFANEEEGTLIDAGLWRDDSQGPRVPGGWIGESYISWNDAAGTGFWVFGYPSSGTTFPSRETLLEVAKSMDPTLDPSKLEGWQSLKSSVMSLRFPNAPDMRVLPNHAEGWGREENGGR